MDRILGWKIAEIKSLFTTMVNGKGQLLPLFELWAKQNNKKTFSVRNYYYKLINLIKSDAKIKNLLAKNGIIVSEKITNHFEDSESEFLLKNLLNNSQKISVRKQCYILAKGDKKLSTRYQNKFRNLIKNNRAKVEKILSELSSQNIPVKNVYNTQNILQFPVAQNHTIKDSEIQSLFWGLVRIVKRNTEQEIAEQIAREKEFTNKLYSNTLIDNRKQAILINELNKENEKIKTQYNNLQKNYIKQCEKYRTDIQQVNEFINSQKIKELKLFLLSLSKKQEKEYI